MRTNEERIPEWIEQARSEVERSVAAVDAARARLKRLQATQLGYDLLRKEVATGVRRISDLEDERGQLAGDTSGNGYKMGRYLALVDILEGGK